MINCPLYSKHPELTMLIRPSHRYKNYVAMAKEVLYLILSAFETVSGTPISEMRGQLKYTWV